MEPIERISRARNAVLAAVGVLEAAVEDGGTAADCEVVIGTLEMAIDELDRAEKRLRDDQAGRDIPSP